MKCCVYFLYLSLLFVLVGCGPDEAKFDSYVIQGQASLRMGNWKSACDNLEKAVRLQPTEGHLQYNLGMACLRSNRMRLAAASFEKASKLLRDDEAIDALLGLARVRAEQRRWVEADEALEAARANAPEYRMVDVLAAQSALRYRQRNWEGARTLAAEALDMHQNHPVALYTLGCLYLYHDGDYPAARRAFDHYYTALGASPDPESNSLPDPRGEVLKGVVPGPRAGTQEQIQRSNEMVHPGEACEVARMAAYADPLEGEAWRNYANHCLRTNRPEEARKAYHRFARLSPNSASMALVPEMYRLETPAAELEKANLAVSTGNLAAAEKQYSQALQKDPECFEALVGLETVSWRKQDYAVALAYAQKANYLRPNQPDLLFRIACYLAPQPQYRKEAIRYYRRFLQFGDATSEQAESVREWIRQVEATPES